jgi:hypothetical protein
MEMKLPFIKKILKYKNNWLSFLASKKESSAIKFSQILSDTEGFATDREFTNVGPFVSLRS